MIPEASLAFLFGLLIGSFLNVCIYRWPRDLSVVRPRSHCVACGETVAWYDNIPLLSYAVLRGRCRRCRAAISPRYPLVELLTGLLFFYAVWTLGPGPEAFKLMLFSAILVGLAFSDLEERILPDELTLGGLACGLALALFVPPSAEMYSALFGLEGRPAWLVESALGAFLPAAFLWGGGWLYERVRHREGLGLGDVKLIAMAGAFLGLRGALLTLILGSLSGSILGYAYIRLKGKDPATYELPFGTFLGAAALVVGFFGQSFDL